MHLLIAAGPTREHLDPVRFLSNASSGRMGVALAAEAKGRGHRVTLLLGPCPAEPPEVDELVRIESTDDLRREAAARFGTCDAYLSPAAPCDYRPRTRRDQKINKGEAALTLRLERTPDVLAELAESRTSQVMVGFCLETEDLEKRARAKLRAKGLDVMVANAPDAIGAERIAATLLTADGATEAFEGSKTDLAARLIALVETLTG